MSLHNTHNTHSSRNTEGGSLILGLIVVVVLGLGVFYLVSDPFSTKIDILATGATKWTPENIRENPVAYLTWASKKCDSSVELLKTSKLSLTIRKNKTTTKSDNLNASIADLNKKLSKAKALFKGTSEWPLVINGNSITQDQLKAKIVASHNKVQNKNKLADSHTKTLHIIGKKLTEIQNKLVSAEQMKETIATDLEVAKTNKAVDGISDINSELNAIIATSDALSGADTDEMSLDDIVGDDTESATNEAFDNIMAE